MQKVVVIIGAGFSGTLTAVNLLSSDSDTKVYLVERRGVFGPGLAYSPPSDRFKLNVRAHAMGALCDNPEGFFEWLQRENLPASRNDFVSRRWYGRYLQSLLENASDERLIRVADEVVDITRDASSKRYSVVCASHKVIEADACVVAIGNLMRTSLDDAQQNIASDPFSRETYVGVREKHSIAILGSGLTAVDAILHAEDEGFLGHYAVISRRGRLPLPHEDVTTIDKVVLPASWEKCGSVAKILAMVREHAKPRGTSQPVIDAMRPKIQEMWKHLSLKERRRFLRHVKAYWEVHRHRIPVEHAQRIQSLQASGRLHIISASIEGVAGSDGQVRVELRSRSGRESRVFDVAILCIGPEGDVEKSRDILSKRLIQRGYVKRGALRLGVESTEERPRQGFFFVGPLQREELWEITAVRELREEAQRVATSVRAFLDVGA
jgi:uncharacterized NAD(P)/FAD-binding protein YdhS